MKILSKHGDEVRLLCGIDERVEVGELLEILEEDRCLVVQVVDLEQESELVLSGNRGREVVTKARLEGIGGEWKIYREWSGWFPLNPTEIRKISAGKILGPDPGRERVPIGIERGGEVVYSPLDSLLRPGVVLGYDSSYLTSWLSLLAHFRNARVTVLDPRGELVRALRKISRRISVELDFERAGEDFKIPLRELGLRPLLDLVAEVCESRSRNVALFTSIYTRLEREGSLDVDSLRRAVQAEDSLRALLDVLDAIEEVVCAEAEEREVEYRILDLSACNYIAARTVLSYFLHEVDRPRHLLVVGGLSEFRIGDPESSARIALAKGLPVLFDVGLDLEHSPMVRYAVNLFLSGPYNRVLEEVTPLLEVEEPLVKRLSSDEYLASGMATANTPLILQKPGPELLEAL